VLGFAAIIVSDNLRVTILVVVTSFANGPSRQVNTT
jgi:hypothetical protein